MRFSLITLVLLVIWTGVLMAVWMWRVPWVLSDVARGDDDYEQQISFSTPDGLREIFFCNFTYVTNGEVELFRFPKGKYTYLIPVHLADNDTLVFRGYTSKTVKPPYDLVTFHRRFPEWWWGHFYRPEVWLAIALSGVLIWRGVRARRRQKIST
jgi:hypothetical protein